MDLFKLTRTLIDIPSVTGSEGKISRFLAEFLREQGFRIKLQRVEGDRLNILAFAEKRPRVVFSTHMDTVPPFFPSSEDKDFIYGRGACDAKGILAAMLWAAVELRKDGLQSLGLLFVVGEESVSDGAKKANEISPGSKYLIVGEPTENKLGSGHKGYLSLRIKVKRKRGHEASPKYGESAVERLLDILSDLRKTDFGEDAVFGKTTFQVGLISGGTSVNVVPETAEAEVSFRLSRPPEQVLARVASVVSGRAKIEVLSRSAPQRFYVLKEYKTAFLPFATDAPYLGNYGTPLLIGPGSIRDAHSDHERIAKRELRAAVKIYKHLARKLIGRESAEIEDNQ
jgi:acetylornithine deacetylase